jgi:hypothetical protein
MRKAARRASVTSWIASGATVTIKAHAKRYGVDKYTAYEDLAAVGFPLGPREAHWAKRPPSTPRRRKEPEPGLGSEMEWIRYGDEIMFVVGYTSGGVPYGYVEPVDESGAACPFRADDPPF